MAGEREGNHGHPQAATVEAAVVQQIEACSGDGCEKNAKDARNIWGKLMALDWEYVEDDLELHKTCNIMYAFC